MSDYTPTYFITWFSAVIILFPHAGARRKTYGPIRYTILRDSFPWMLQRIECLIDYHTVGNKSRLVQEYTDRISAFRDFCLSIGYSSGQNLEFEVKKRTIFLFYFILCYSII